MRMKRGIEQVPPSNGKEQRHHRSSHPTVSRSRTKGKLPPDPGLRKRVARTRAHGTGQAKQSFNLATILPSKPESFLAT
jgi:hypothetical protein